MSIVIAIDGYVATGKGVTAQGVARALGYRYLDTGAMYRAITLYMVQKGLQPEQEEEITQALEEITLEVTPKEDKTHVILNGTDVTDNLRSMEVTNVVATMAKVPAMRTKLRALQRAIGKDGGIVVDGRDMGSVVFPDAELKIFMKADTKIRAKRRLLQMEKDYKEHGSLEDIEKNINQRDQTDYD